MFDLLRFFWPLALLHLTDWLNVQKGQAAVLRHLRGVVLATRLYSKQLLLLASTKLSFAESLILCELIDLTFTFTRRVTLFLTFLLDSIFMNRFLCALFGLLLRCLLFWQKLWMRNFGCIGLIALLIVWQLFLHAQP